MEFQLFQLFSATLSAALVWLLYVISISHQEELATTLQPATVVAKRGKES